jgi:hypothetical protein
VGKVVDVTIDELLHNAFYTEEIQAAMQRNERMLRHFDAIVAEIYPMAEGTLKQEMDAYKQEREITRLLSIDGDAPVL